jgi:hypothetical protein
MVAEICITCSKLLPPLPLFYPCDLLLCAHIVVQASHPVYLSCTCRTEGTVARMAALGLRVTEQQDLASVLRACTTWAPQPTVNI